MKKKAGIILLITLIACVAIAGCGNKEEADRPYNYDLAEYVKVSEYHDLPYNVKVAEVTDEDVENEIKARLQYASTTESITEGVVEDGDTINIAFVGKIDGELFDGGSSESYDLTVGTTSMIDGFVEGLIGQPVGETVTLDLQFPEEYHSAEVAGKPVVFEVTINSKRVITTPEFNDEFVQSTSEFQTVDEYRANLKEVLTKQAQDQLDARVRDYLWEIIVAKSEALKYPEEEMNKAKEAADAMEAEYKNQATLYGLEWADFLSMFMGTTEEGFAEMKEDYAKNMVLSEMVMYKMSRDESVDLTQKEFEELAKGILKDSSFTEESFQSTYGMTIVEYAEQNGWKNGFLLDKLMDKVIEYGHEVSEDEFDSYVKEELGLNDEASVEITEEAEESVEENPEENSDQDSAEEQDESEGN